MSNNHNIPASQQIDTIIQAQDNWKQEILSDIRSALLATSSDVIEEVKWKTPSRPLGLPVWSHEGILCFAEIWNDNVKLLFAKGARMENYQNILTLASKAPTFAQSNFARATRSMARLSKRSPLKLYTSTQNNSSTKNTGDQPVFSCPCKNFLRF